MSVAWYEWRNMRNRLEAFGKAVQGISPYRVLIEPDVAKCPSGYCNFTRREIAVNPTMFALLPKDQYQLTKALLVHEAGHRRFTAPTELSPLVHQIANILEDERIERQMCGEFAGVRWLIRRLSEVLYNQSEIIDETSDSPGEVVAYFLQLRWAERISQPVKGGLSPQNIDLWQKIEPLVFQSWKSESSELVDHNAQEIVRILGLRDFEIPEWVKEILDLLGTIEGNRVSGDKAEAGTLISKENQTSTEKPENHDPFDGEVLPNDRRVGDGDIAIEPRPYIDLEERVKHLVQELVEELHFDEAPNQWEPVVKGGKFAMRQYLRDRDLPFLAQEEFGKALPTMVLKVIVDHSTSMNHAFRNKTRMESIAEAVMMLHLVCRELDIPHEVIVTPQGVKITDLKSGESGKALIAGLMPALCGYEDMGFALETHAVPMADYTEDIKLVLCLTDGACNDATLGENICRNLNGKVDIIGVLLDPDTQTRKYVAKMFGEDRLIACQAHELPGKLGNMLRAIRGI